MLLEVKTEIVQLILDKTFRRNLSLVFLSAIACYSGLAELHSQTNSLSDRTSITNVSRSSQTKIIMKN